MIFNMAFTILEIITDTITTAVINNSTTDFPQLPS